MLTELLSTVIGAGATGAVGLVYSLIAGRFRAARDKAAKYENLADQQEKIIDNLKDQIRDLRTVALVQKSLGRAQPKGSDDDE